MLTILTNLPLALFPLILNTQLLTCVYQEVGALHHKEVLEILVEDITLPVPNTILASLLLLPALPTATDGLRITLLLNQHPLLIARKNFKLSRPKLAVIAVAVWVYHLICLS